MPSPSTNVGQKTREVLEKIPGSSVNTVERCSGHAGTWGVRKIFTETALKIGKPVFRQMKTSKFPSGTPDVIASDAVSSTSH